MYLNGYYRQKRKSEFIRRAVFFGAAIMLFIVLILGSFWLPYFRVSSNRITVEGGHTFADVEGAVAPYLASVNKFFLPKNNWLLLSEPEVAEAVKNANLGAVSVSKEFPNRLLIKFTAYEPWAIFCKTTDMCFYVSNSGVMYDLAPQFSENPLHLLILPAGKENALMGDAVLSDKKAIFLKNSAGLLDGLNASASTIDLTKAGEIKITTKPGWFLLLSEDADAKRVLGELKLLFDQKIKNDAAKLEYIDMRFPNKAFYKLQN